MNFSLPGVSNLHSHRIKEISDVFVSLGDVDVKKLESSYFDAPLVYALLHHLLERAVYAANISDRAEFFWCFNVFSGETKVPSLDTEIGKIIVSKFDESYTASDQVSEMPAPPFSSNTVGMFAEEVLNTIKYAVAYAEEAGFKDLLRLGCRVIIPLKLRHFNEPASSWTTTRLPGTVFLDYYKHGALLARDLIHESGHNWLNDCLLSYSENLADNIQFYSPWKRCERPVFGFIHSLLAFSLVVKYCKWASQSDFLEESECKFLAAVALAEQERLTEVKSDALIAFNYLSSPELRDFLISLFENALAN